MSQITKGRMISVDALRGIAAFLVVVFHVYGSGALFQRYLSLETLDISNIPYFLPAYGYVGVYLFFVISGFCIHLRWAKARSNDNRLSPKINFLAFWKRRWIRLYPAYLAAMFLFLLYEYLLDKIVFNGFFVWDLVSHVLMIHNLDNRTVYSMNGVFWTLAIEEQLYLLYFLLLALREKWGWSVTISIAFASRFVWLGISLFVTTVFGFELPFNEGALANWWIWAIGALAVENYYRVVELPRWCRSLLIALLFLLFAGILHYLGFSSPATALFSKTAFLFEPLLWGAGFFLLINNVTAREFDQIVSGVYARIFSACGFLGLFSYSLYLTHELIIKPLEGTNRFLIIILSLIFAYLFFLVFEKPFMVYLTKRKEV